MSEKSIEFTIRIISSIGDSPSIRSMLPTAPSREGVGDRGRDYRFFLDVLEFNSTDFEDSLEISAKVAVQYADLLTTFDVEIDLWCTIHGDSNFSGMAISPSIMNMLGQHQVHLVLSVYAATKGTEAE
jgi:hypothetical protein